MDNLLPPANEVWGKVIFFTHVCHSVHGGGVCLSACWDTIPQDHAPPPGTMHPPPGTTHPPSGPCTPREQCPPPRRACWEIRSTRGRYASYWNAILFKVNSLTLCHFIRLIKDSSTARVDGTSYVLV